MTTQKLFKRRVRARMAKTGESYTTARRHVAVKQDSLQAEPPNLAAAEEMASDARLTEVTGRSWSTWITILDRWGARERTHTETARYLVADHGVRGWWSQTITNGYERARGIRVKHQQRTGFTISVSRTIGAPIGVLFDAFIDEPVRSRWLTDGAMSIRSSHPTKVARFEWDGGPTRVMVTFEGKGRAKATAVVTHERLTDADAAAAAKTQ
jgi:hypothetical protein